MSKKTKKQIEQYEHSKEERSNIPHVGLVTPESDPETGEKKTYEYDPHLDPQLQWAGKNKSQDSESIVDKIHTSFNFQKGSNPQTISFNAGEKLFSKEYPPITSEYIGKLPIPKMAMENPYGTPLDITTDYLGTPVNQKKVMPGPFQEIKSKENKFIVWPKKNSQKRKL